MREKLEYSYRRFAKEDEPAIQQLIKDAFPPTQSNLWFWLSHMRMQDTYWVWKYKLNPDFDPSLVVVAERDGQIVGCNHWLVRDFKLSISLKVKASLGADVVVHPKHRGRGVGKELLKFLRETKTFKENRAIIAYMFTDPNLNRYLYGPTLGYVAAPYSTTRYKKFLNCRRLREELQLINSAIQAREELQRELKRLDMSILFRLRGSPAFSLVLTHNQIDLVEKELENTDFLIEGNSSLFYSALEGRIGTSSLVKALLTRKLKVRKGKWKALKLIKAFRAIRRARKIR